MTDSTRTGPDPIAQAAAYQQSLLAALGDDDPADVQAEAPGTIRALLADAGPQLRTRPAPREWSAPIAAARWRAPRTTRGVMASSAPASSSYARVSVP